MEVTPEPTTIAEQLSQKDGIKYTTGQKKYHTSGTIVFEVHTQVEKSVVDGVKETLENHGYRVTENEAETFEGRIIVEGVKEV